MYVIIFFFFKQKTAYEMRISDWSSDVCSSDLAETRSETKRFSFSSQKRCWCRFGSKRRRRRLLACETVLPTIGRSEEHTSELQSLMRNSYAVFCLKKKIKNNIINTHYNLYNMCVTYNGNPKRTAHIVISHATTTDDTAQRLFSTN